jgi:hypothetical protein
MVKEEHFLGAFAKFRKTAISFVLSVRVELGSTGWIFMEIYIWVFVEILSRKFKFH